MAFAHANHVQFFFPGYWDYNLVRTTAPPLAGHFLPISESFVYAFPAYTQRSILCGLLCPWTQKREIFLLGEIQLSHCLKTTLVCLIVV